MTDDRPTTTDALAYLRDALHIHAADPGVWVDARTLSLALAEFAAARDRVAALEAALRDVCAAADGVQAGVAHLGGYVDNSVVAEVCAFFNGYAGGPDLDAAVDAARALLGDA